MLSKDYAEQGPRKLILACFRSAGASCVMLVFDLQSISGGVLLSSSPKEEQKVPRQKKSKKFLAKRRAESVLHRNTSECGT